jgi:hypothetical protein
MTTTPKVRQPTSAEKLAARVRGEEILDADWGAAPGPYAGASRGAGPATAGDEYRGLLRPPLPAAG